MKKLDYVFPDKISAAIIVQQNHQLLLDYIKMPDALDYGQVLIKVH